MTSIDDVLPSFHHRERHSRWIGAPPEAVWAALQRVRFDELPVMRFGLALRTLPARLRGRSQPPPTGRFLDGFKARGFTLFVEERGRTIVGGAIGRQWKSVGAERAQVAGLSEFVAFARPGWAKVATDFRLEPERGGTRLSTETRVLATDARARRAFTCYWILIRGPSGLIRRDLLRAIARRAESKTAASQQPGERAADEEAA